MVHEFDWSHTAEGELSANTTTEALSPPLPDAGSCGSSRERSWHRDGYSARLQDQHPSKLPPIADNVFFFPPTQPGFSRMTLSSHRLKASSSFFTAKAGRHPFLRPRDVGTTPARQPGGSVLLQAPPMYTAGRCYDHDMGLAWCWKR